MGRSALARFHPATPDRRVLVLAATSRDAELAEAVLSEADLAVAVCNRLETLVAQLRAGAAVVVIAEEMLTSERTSALAGVLAEQPAWSDVPLLVLTRTGADSREAGEAVAALGNVTLLERPLRVATLLTAVRSAMRARERQYEIRRHLAERERAEAVLREADRRKDEFLATLGHELRNPLAPLQSSLQLLKVSAGDDAVMWRLAEVMTRQLGHLTRLVDDLLELSRITRGVIDVRREPVDLGFVVRSAIETCRPAIDGVGHDLRLSEPAAPVTVEGDVIRLTQVFANLVGNAAKYTNPGGHIRVAIRREQDRAVVSVRDDGIGIPQSELQSVFDMFTQVDRSSRRAQGGLGIGLTLVRSLVAMHGGRVEARSPVEGGGSEFVVTLPVLAAATLKPRVDASIPLFPARRLLIVDDNADAADSLGDLLSTLGATVRVVHSGQEALTAVPTFRPDAVLLDIGMPGMDGYEVARRIRATVGQQRVLLVAVTGWGQDHDQERARAAGFDHHMVKPPDLAELRHVLTAS